jgi:hypothetical protein
LDAGAGVTVLAQGKGRSIAPPGRHAAGSIDHGHRRREKKRRTEVRLK